MTVPDPHGLTVSPCFGTTTLSHRMPFDFVLICLLALALWGAALGVERLIRQERQDRS